MLVAMNRWSKVHPWVNTVVFTCHSFIAILFMYCKTMPSNDLVERDIKPFWTTAFMNGITELSLVISWITVESLTCGNPSLTPPHPCESVPNYMPLSKVLVSIQNPSLFLVWLLSLQFWLVLSTIACGTPTKYFAMITFQSRVCIWIYYFWVCTVLKKEVKLNGKGWLVPAFCLCGCPLFSLVMISCKLQLHFNIKYKTESEIDETISVLIIIAAARVMICTVCQVKEHSELALHLGHNSHKN